MSVLPDMACRTSILLLGAKATARASRPAGR